MNSLLPCCKTTELTVRGEFAMPGISAVAAERVFRDIEAAPQFVPHLLSVEFLRGKASTVGACWLERRRWNRDEIVVRKSITELSQVPHFTCRTTVRLETRLHSWTPDFLQTNTVVVVPVDDAGGGGCVAHWSIAIFVLGIWSNVPAKLFFPFYQRSIVKNIQEEMKCYYNEARRRHQQEPEKEEATKDETLDKVSFPRRSVPKAWKN